MQYYILGNIEKYIVNIYFLSSPLDLYKSKIFVGLIIISIVINLIGGFKKGLFELLWGADMIIGSLLMFSIGMTNRMQFSFGFVPALIAFILGSGYCLLLIFGAAISLGESIINLIKKTLIKAYD